jgi:hypothetical protein
MYKILIPLILGLFPMCNTSKQLSNSVNALVPLIIYKTKGDYSNNVPIILNAKKDKLISYPAPKDVYYNGKLAIPEKLKLGYYLDNMGISINTVYTSYTFTEYAKLESAPKIEDLMNSIVDSDPFLEIYSCGNRIDIETKKYLNKLIDNKFKDCKKIK